jgi:hypothetical protein
MLFAVIFHDKSGQGELRSRLLPEHLTWLDEHRLIVIIGGSLREEVKSVPIGGLWLVEANAKSEVDALIRTDPFYVSGLRESYEVLHWSKAFADRKVSL